VEDNVRLMSSTPAAAALMSLLHDDSGSDERKEGKNQPSSSQNGR
jgi:hypothetical protein